jgi:hypothetical protein
MNYGFLYAIVPTFLIATTFLLAWVAPWLFSDSTLYHFSDVLVMEFFVIHMSAFTMPIMAVGKTSLGKVVRVILLVGLAAFYTWFLCRIPYFARSWWPLIAFWALMARRLWAAYLTTAEAFKKTAVGVEWAVSGAAYVIIGLSTAFILPVPRFGISEAVAGRIAKFGAGGVWIEQPHRMFCMGFLYFSALILWEYAKKRLRETGIPVEPEDLKGDDA